MIGVFLKLCLILPHSASLAKFGRCSYEVIKSTRTKSLQEKLGKFCPVRLRMSLDVPMEPLKCFMFQMKGCKGDFIEIKSVMQTEILFYPINPSSRIITIEARKIQLWPMEVARGREPSVCRRLRLSSIVHG